MALLLGALIAGLFGLILGLPALRMRGLYLALLTLMIAAALQVVVNVIGFPAAARLAGKIVAASAYLSSARRSRVATAPISATRCSGSPPDWR